MPAHEAQRATTGGAAAGATGAERDRLIAQAAKLITATDVTAELFQHVAEGALQYGCTFKFDNGYLCGTAAADGSPFCRSHCGRKWFIDSAHGWLRVTAEDVKRSGFKPSPYSYQGAEFVYLEEDCDASGFLDAIGGDYSVNDYPRDYVDGERQDVRGLPRVKA